MLSWSFCLLLGWGQLHEEKDVRDPQAIHITLEHSSSEGAVEKGKYWAAASTKPSPYGLHNLSVQHDLWYGFSKVWCLVMSQKSRPHMSIICRFVKTLYTPHIPSAALPSWKLWWRLGWWTGRTVQRYWDTGQGTSPASWLCGCRSAPTPYSCDSPHPSVRKSNCSLVRSLRTLHLQWLKFMLRDWFLCT